MLSFVSLALGDWALDGHRCSARVTAPFAIARAAGPAGGISLGRGVSEGNRRSAIPQVDRSHRGNHRSSRTRTLPGRSPSCRFSFRCGRLPARRAAVALEPLRQMHQRPRKLPVRPTNTSHAAWTLVAVPHRINPSDVRVKWGSKLLRSASRKRQDPSRSKLLWSQATGDKLCAAARCDPARPSAAASWK